MKVINYYRGYVEKFTCVIDGTIDMTVIEYKQVVHCLRHNAGTIKQSNAYFSPTLLEEDLKRRIEIKDKSGFIKQFLVNIRVSATEALIKEFGLRNYKRGNYQLRVTQYK